MQSGALIQCSNPRCQAFNPLTNKSCHRCRTPIIKRYLWTVGESLEHQVGDLIGDRYLVKQPRTVLDTKPSQVPQVPHNLPEFLTPYLRLFPYRLHVPQVYGAIYSQYFPERAIWLLEYSAVPTDQAGELKYQQFLPHLDQIWQQATALRQLNWLWQMASLWQPLQSQGVASSLLNSALVRANGAVVGLIELHSGEQPTLIHLGQFWSEWTSKASPSIAKFHQQLCTKLINQEINKPEQLLTVLEQGIRQSGRSQQYRTQIFTCTDAGPVRKHNEDTCYPPPDRPVTAASEIETLTIVCDGIGGQEGGEIASELAVTSLQKQIKDLALDQPSEIALHLEQIICAVNDLISERNDREQRTERQRMGTTLTMAIACTPEIYLSHVGDSRVYWITFGGCHQVTVDDDIASREARLGHVYRSALREPNAGTLCQALGMYSSRSLQPTVQRLILDEDCVFLLCSDGLSDFSRVEQHWKPVILPILRQKKDVETAGRRLLEIANKQNGHDNATVALVYCQVQPSAEPLPELELFISSPSAEAETKQHTVPVVKPSSTHKPRFWIPILIAVVLGIGAIGFWIFQRIEEDQPKRLKTSVLQASMNNDHCPLRGLKSETECT